MSQDLYCQVCEEPWDLYHIQNDITAEERKTFLSGQGCQSCKGESKYKTSGMRSMLMGAMQDIMGDDLDGIASSMEDAEYMGYFQIDDSEFD